MQARPFFLLVSPILLGAALWAVIHFRPHHDSGDLLYWDHAIHEEVQRTVDGRYIEPLDESRQRELFDAAMQGYVGRLDPFSRYFTPAERRALDEDTSGSFAGVGVQIGVVDEGLLVTAVYRDGPADQAGVEPGDVIVRVDDELAAGRGLRDMVKHVKGPEATPVTLHVVRGDAPEMPLEVRRGLVELDTVPAVRLFEGDLSVAYVRLSQFSESTPAEVRAQLDEMVTQKGAQAVVLDVRHNLGGVVRAAVEVAGIFLAEDAVVCVTRSRDRAFEYSVESSDAPIEVPLVVLIDDTSASASEILAGALQDHGRAVLVGERTYGKFLVQTLLGVDASDGQALVRLTTARYETPHGRSGQRVDHERVRGGIMPDVRVTLSDDERTALEDAFVAQAGPRWRVIDGREETGDADPQLQHALDLLRGAQPPSEPIPIPPPEQG